MTRQTNQAGVELIKRFEGLRTKAYLCPAKVWTIGYGHTSAAGPPSVGPGKVITAGEAVQILKNDLKVFEAAVEKAVKVPLTDNEFAALVSFTFNLGSGTLARSTLLRKLNQGKYDAVPGELARYVYAGKQKLEGLVRRRAAEASLWSSGVPREPLKPVVKPPVKQETKDAAVIAGVGTAGGLGTFPSEQVLDVVKGQQEALSSGSKIMIAVSLVIILLALFAAWQKWKQA